MDAFPHFGMGKAADKIKFYEVYATLQTVFW